MGMDNIRDFYILGLPIDTEIGKLYPTLMKDYPELMNYVGILTFDKDDLIKGLEVIINQTKELQPILDYANAVGLFDFIISFKDDEYESSFLRQPYEQYKKLFEFCFKEDVFDKVKSNDELIYYTNLIKEVNDIKYEKPNPNPEIAKFDMLKKKLQEAKGETITFEAMYTSVLLSSGVHPNEMTIYQFNKAFDRIGHFKNYETTTLFKTVDASGKLEIHPWYATTKEEKPSFITDEQLNKAKQQIKEGGLQTSL